MTTTKRFFITTLMGLALLAPGAVEAAKWMSFAAVGQCETRERIVSGVSSIFPAPGGLFYYGSSPGQVEFICPIQNEDAYKSSRIEEVQVFVKGEDYPPSASFCTTWASTGSLTCDPFYAASGTGNRTIHLTPLASQPNHTYALPFVRVRLWSGDGLRGYRIWWA